MDKKEISKNINLCPNDKEGRHCGHWLMGELCCDCNADGKDNLGAYARGELK